MSSARQDRRRLDAYVRVSQTRGREGEKFTSPHDQEKAIRQWADLYGYEITDDGPDGDGAWHELDVSGGTMDRPKLNEVLARIDAGDSDGIAVYRLDRFGRTLIGALTIIERLYDDGKLFASVMDNFDIATENGRLVLRIMLSLGQYERERIQSTWRTARNNAVERGWHVSGSRPFGYRREQLVNRKGEPYLGGLIVDDVEAPIVKELYRRRAAGESWSRLARWMRSTGIPTSRGKTAWNVRAMSSLIANPVYLGHAGGAARDKKGIPMTQNTTAHDPLVDRATWEAAQATAKTPKRAARGESHDALAGGLVRCASCRYVMSVGPYRNGGGPRVLGVRYWCMRQSRSGDCPHPVMIPARRPSGEPGLDYVIAERVIQRLSGDPDAPGFIPFDADDGLLGELEARHAAAVADSAEYGADLELQNDMSAEAWRARGRALADAEAAALDALRHAKRDAEQKRRAGGRSGREVVDDWLGGRLSPQDKRDLVAGMVQAVFVRPDPNRDGDVRSAAAQAAYMDKLRDRVHIVWDHEPAIDVPRQGRRDWAAKPFEFPA